MRDYKAYLLHILDETDYLMRHASGIDLDGLMRDETLKRSFVRSLEVIGEAIKNLPPEFRDAHPGIEWKKIAGLRDVLIHHYFGVDYRMVWDIVKNRVPELKAIIEKLL
ncbi:MAG: DUF86 domain-containing protein [Spirochaetota bacterium]